LLVEAFVLPKADLGSFVAKLKAGYEVIGPVSKDPEFVFAPIDSAADLRLDYDTTILPPHKKYLAPPKETLMTFSGRATKTGEPAPAGKQVLFGVHACDVNGMLSLDKVFLGTYPDPYYKARRESTVIVGLNCTEPCAAGFCSSFNTGPGMDTGFDLSLTDIGDKYLVCVGSEAGKALAEGLTPAADADRIAKGKALRASQEKILRHVDTDNLGEFMHQNVDNPVWADLKERCLACGSCTNVCPTCFCFAVKDQVDLGLAAGERPRDWDSCQYLEFSRVAMDHIFRPDRAARIKQRLYHKMTYFAQQFDGSPGCVGCGRCATYCVAAIDPVEVMEDLRDNPGEEKAVKLYTPPDRKITPETNPWEPLPAKITAIKQQNYDNKTYTFEFVDPAVRDKYVYDNGVFNEISVFGIGEVPISISSCADVKGSFDHTIRAVGNVTKALDRLTVGDIVGVRGPYGFGWPVEEMKGKNVLVVVGGVGLAPLLGTIKHIANHRDQYGALEILYGSRSPKDMLFTDEFEDLRKIPNTRLLLCVDNCMGMEWGHNIGVVTTLFDKMSSTPDNSVMITCGPDIMMRFAVKDLLGRGWSPEQIYVSLERRMSCGIKKCGNCQIGPLFVCQDGPVFKLADIQGLPEAAL
jgi:NAD(P)H-flavin reductase/formate hydrogenlyase subunit 6/NADH:ubiquinone oxidoreductase subunit I